jgi:aspartyl/asparaginyl beta-hydroxylase (cupin superfamily)
MSKIVYFISEQDQYHGPEPDFYQPEAYSWVKTLEENWCIIRDEMEPIISGKEPIELSSSNPPFLSNATAWKNIYFFNFMWKSHRNIRRFPKTHQLLKSIPNLTFAEFTVLEPHSKILPHIGETNATIRGHLGIDIPYPYPKMGIHVGKEEKGWENGKVILFSDASIHYVWNDSDKRRFILVFDVIKAENSHKKLWICAQSLGALTVKWFTARFTTLEKTPRILKRLFFTAFSICWFLYLPLQRRVNFLP